MSGPIVVVPILWFVLVLGLMSLHLAALDAVDRAASVGRRVALHVVGWVSFGAAGGLIIAGCLIVIGGPS